MSNQNGFFGDIFGSADDDPLLQSDEDVFSSRGDGASQSVSEPQSQPQSESSSGSSSETSSPASSSPKTEAMEVQAVVLRQSGNETRGLAELNEAVEDGWRFSHVSLDDRIRSTSGDVDTEITILMERNTPRSLFDFGGTY